jgi:hypothetical protein
MSIRIRMSRFIYEECLLSGILLNGVVLVVKSFYIIYLIHTAIIKEKTVSVILTRARTISFRFHFKKTIINVLFC